MTSRVGNSGSILDFNSRTRLKYSSRTFQLNSNTQVKNSDLNRVLTSRELDLTSMTRLDAISLARIQDSKYLTQLNIIITFNKLCMSIESENLITFVTFFNVYKYRVMLFELINESTFFQHYINDVLFNYLHKFCQIYLNDILICSKILKKHRTHVKEMLDKFREVDLQIDIDKCKFKIQKISFLKLLIFINDLRMNFRKVDVIWSWKVSRSLTHVQIFIDFCNFYRWFIKNFSKIIQSMIKLIQKDHSFE